MTITNTSIHLHRVKLFAHHGVLPQERATGAYFYISLQAETDFGSALHTDELTGTVSYADLFEAVRQEMAVPSALLEHVAGRILHRIFRDFASVSAVHLSLTKENPPMGADCQGAGIEISARR